MLAQACRRVAEIGGLAVVLLLPLWVNPFAAQPFEPAKVALFRALSAVITLTTATTWLLARRGTARGSIRGSGNRQTGMLLCNPLAMMALIFAGICVLETLTSINPTLSLWGTPDNLQGTVTALCAIAFFLSMATLLQAPDYARHVVTFLLLGSVPVAVYGLAQYLGFDPFDWMTDSVSPVLSTLGRSNFLGAYLAMVVPFTLSRLAVPDLPSHRLRYGLVLALQVVCLLLTMARGAWLGLMAGCVVFLTLLAYCRKSRGVLAAAVVTLFVGAGLFASMDHLPQLGRGRAHVAELSRSSGASLDELRDISVQSRLLIWKGTVALMPDHWWLGYGPETFKAVFAAHYPAELAQLVGPGLEIDDPHNLFLHQLVTTGILGTAGYLSVVAVFYWLTGRTFRDAADPATQVTLAATLASVTAFLVEAQFNPVVIVLTTLFWLDLAMAAGAGPKLRPCLRKA